MTLHLVTPPPPKPEPAPDPLRPLWMWLAVAPWIVGLSIAQAALEAWARPTGRGGRSERR